MKTLISIAILFVTVNLYAFPDIIYRCRFEPYNDPCWQAGNLYPTGTTGTYTEMDGASGAHIYTIPSGGCIVLTISYACCGENPMMGYQWEESSADGGVTWSLVSPTFVETVMPMGYRSAQYDNSTGTLGDPILLRSCP